MSERTKTDGHPGHFVFVKHGMLAPQLFGPFSDEYAANRCGHALGLGEPNVQVWVLRAEPFDLGVKVPS